jgi:predicted metal-dependent hydrolase
MRDVLALDGIQYAIKRTGKNSMGISVERDGTVIVTAPQEAPLEEIEEYVSSKLLWIHRKLTYKKETNKEKIHRDFVNGQGFLYLGKSYRLRLLKNDDNFTVKKTKDASHLRLIHGYFELPASEQGRARDHFMGWYKRKTEEHMTSG